MIRGQRCFLRLASDPLENAIYYFTVTDAVNAFERQARQLARFGQRLEATLHYVDSVSDVPAEYPNCVLSLGPRGGLRVENA